MCLLENMPATPQFGFKTRTIFCGALLGICTAFGNSQPLDFRKNYFPDTLFQLSKLTADDSCYEKKIKWDFHIPPKVDTSAKFQLWR